MSAIASRKRKRKVREHRVGGERRIKGVAEVVLDVAEVAEVSRCLSVRC